MIDNNIIESFLKCKYKAYLLLKNQRGTKKEYEVMQKSMKDELFTFLDYDGIPWNNNNAEYAIKHFADYRGAMKGLMTDKSLESYLVLLSIYQTCKYKGINFLDFLLSKEKDIDKFQTRK